MREWKNDLKWKKFNEMCDVAMEKYRQSETIGNVCDCLFLTTKNIKKNMAIDAAGGATLLLALLPICSRHKVQYRIRV